MIKASNTQIFDPKTGTYYTYSHNPDDGGAIVRIGSIHTEGGNGIKYTDVAANKVWNEVSKLCNAYQVVNFGEGRVGVMRTAEKGEDFSSGLAFNFQEQKPIFEVTPGFVGKTVAESGCFLQFHFSHWKSAQLIIEDLTIIRDERKARQEPENFFCPKCDGTGYKDGGTDEPCAECNGTGKRKPYGGAPTE